MSQENQELDIDTQLKQTYLRKEIIEKGHSAEKFSELLATMKPGNHSLSRCLFNNEKMEWILKSGKLMNLKL